MRVSRTIAFGCAVSALILACDGGGGSTSGGGGAGDAQSFVNQYCDVFQPCCAQAGRPTDGAVCRALLGGVTASAYNAAKGQQCLDEMHAAQSKPDFCNGIPSPASCNEAFATGGGGTVQPGGQCSKDGDCASTGEGKVDCQSSFTNGATTRYCQVQIDGKAGDTPCLGTRDGNLTSYSGGGSTDKPTRGFICDLANGVRCDSTSKACVALKNSGETCSGATSDCVKTAYCDFTQKKCVDRLPTDSPCGVSGSTDVCQPKNYCDTTTKKCTVQLGVGAGCARSDQCESKSCVNGKCGAGGDLGLALLCGGG